MTYYVTFECEVCDQEINYGLCATTIEHNGHPVIPIDIASQTRVDCHNCGAKHYFGELDVYVEGGEAPEVEDEDEDEDY